MIRRLPIKIGLTGSIGMGKSTIAAMFAAEGVPVWDADAAVHRLYSGNAALIDELSAVFGDVAGEAGIDRARLSAAVHALPEGFDRLNALVHPHVVADREAFIAAHPDAPVVLADIPLLYETGADQHLDKVVVVSAPPEVQSARVLARPGMDQARFAAILARQMPDVEKRARADYLIDTGQSLEACRDQVRAILADLSAS
ncbi:dephospho-CoA kinase [Asticcacaulis sp. EMRT-3]|uniref:dephospho-CoA kinase n=1 Tax=Asticcacaulis sp. EMRT-3 TaxID=3040349 RepID=UPI0024AF80E3|nr:dephospho-CoA kinase [Asticcacaulis sp. EMRT-3]MDI7775829.1 dephospho-CoA kinase [Asticcacaulis sp. EMRT-3]